MRQFSSFDDFLKEQGIFGEVELKAREKVLAWKKTLLQGAKKVETITVSEYFDREKVSDLKHEYENGAVYAMMGESETHNLISTNLSIIIGSHLKGMPCDFFSSSMKIYTPFNGANYYYPDGVVSCTDLKDKYIVDKPTLIIEILSDSTEKKDKDKKLTAYLAQDSLKEYILISQNKVKVEVYKKTETGIIYKPYSDNGIIDIDSINLSLSVKDIYNEVR